MTRLEPSSSSLQAEIGGLKKQVELLEREKKGDQQKVQNLNIQLSTLVRQAKTDKKGFEKREGELREVVMKEKAKNELVRNELADRERADRERVNKEQANKEKEKSLSRQLESSHQPEFAPPSSAVQSNVDRELKAKYDALEVVAREVAKECGLMAGDNFGPIGKALAKLKRHMGE